MTNKSELTEKLKAELQTATWPLLEEHAKNDRIIVVSNKLDIINVGIHVATDNTDQVGQWIQSGEVAKPTLEQIDLWKNTQDMRFLFLIIQPYVLLQPFSS